MKTLLGILIMVLVSFQVNATGYAHNMLVAQKILKTKKADPIAELQSLTLQLQAKATTVKSAPSPNNHASDAEETVLRPDEAAASFSDKIARWVVRVVSESGSVLVEKLISLFASNSSVAVALPDNARFLSLTDNVVSYLLMPLAQR